MTDMTAFTKVDRELLIIVAEGILNKAKSDLAQVNSKIADDAWASKFPWNRDVDEWDKKNRAAGEEFCGKLEKLVTDVKAINDAAE